MKRWMKWALLALLVGLLASSVWRALSSRQAQQATVARLAADRSQPVVELGALDVIEVRSRDMAIGLAISGALKAVNSAIVKARVAGELQDLTVREGDTVKAGQIIARVDPGEYQARVRQAQQLAESAKAQVDIARRAF
ncbi:MAG: biotin/lipoyl-binding protein, partial [Comamonadaceae bacterium]